MTAQTPVGSTKVPLPLPFGGLVDDAPGTLFLSVSNVQRFEYTMPQAGSVIGYSVALDGTLNTGTLQFQPTKNGAVMPNAFTNGKILPHVLNGYERTAANQPGFSFAAGDSVGLMFSKTGTVEPITATMLSLLIVLLDRFEY